MSRSKEEKAKWKTGFSLADVVRTPFFQNFRILIFKNVSCFEGRVNSSP